MKPRAKSPIRLPMKLKVMLPFLFFMAVCRATGTDRDKSVIPFPAGFWWGTSLAAHQCEGGNVNNWTRWESVPGHIRNNDKSGLADDHWNKFDEDFANLNWLHANTHRMSIEWSRLEPRPGVWNEEAARHYRLMISDLKNRGIRPVICLFHFSLPLWVEDAGGFENPKMIQAFVEFARRAQAEFGDLVQDWFTLNEPIAYALGGYVTGVLPPGVKDAQRAVNVMANLLRAHALAYHAIKEQDPRARISFAQHLRAFAPKDPFSPLDIWGAHEARELVNWNYYEAIQSGRIRIRIPTVASVDEECPECVGTLDYVAFNYYTRDLISVNLFSHDKFSTSTSQSGLKTDMGWEIYPQGMAEVLEGIKAKGLGKYPVLISENGIADDADKYRPLFIYEHLKIFLETCQKLGLTPMGYLHWTLMDNFEWNSGFFPHFGLFAVDYKTQKRTPRPSAFYFREMGMTHRLLPPP